MRLLFIGGTSFVGRHGVEAAVAAGHDVTVFHRGRTNDDLLAGAIDHRHGDRSTGDYSALADDAFWDAVIDVSAYVPRHVHQLADVVGGRAGHCVHISSISAYDDATISTGEDSPLYADLADPAVDDVTNETYGPLKAMCERAARQRFAKGARRSSGRRTWPDPTTPPIGSRTGRGEWRGAATWSSAERGRRCRSSTPAISERSSCTAPGRARRERSTASDRGRRRRSSSPR
jgi:hypothetical protein